MALPLASKRPAQYFDSNLSFKFLSTNTSMLFPLALTGNVATFSGGARLPKMTGPRNGGKGHQSPTTEPNRNERRKNVSIWMHCINSGDE